MPRPKLEHGQIAIQGKLSENKVPLEVLNFVKNEIDRLGQAKFVLEAVSIYYKYKTGKLFGEEIEKKLMTVLPKVLENYNLGQIASTKEMTDNRTNNKPINLPKEQPLILENYETTTIDADVESEIENLRDSGMLDELLNILERGEG